MWTQWFVPALTAGAYFGFFKNNAFQKLFRMSPYYGIGGNNYIMKAELPLLDLQLCFGWTLVHFIFERKAHNKKYWILYITKLVFQWKLLMMLFLEAEPLDK